MKRVIVSGATSMVGSALIRLLISKGIKVLALYHSSTKKFANIPSSELVKLHPCAADEFDKLVAEDKPYDVFFHFAWSGTYGDARNDFALQKLNVKYAKDAANAAARLGCTCFVGAGSQAEYGPVEFGVKLSPLTKTHPLTAYGQSKLEAMFQTRDVAIKTGMRHIWMRILSVYGPNDNDFTAVMQLIRKLKAGEHISLTKGEQIWDYLYCADAAQAFYLAARFGKANAVYVLGSGQCAPLRKYFEEIRDICAPEAKLGFGEIPYSESAVMYLCADISDLRADTAFEPQVPFRDGILNILKGFST
ncbi:MAG: NAD(P)-dependent oxidoreductase [Clostridia bacterium]|nr:NAD(P)-dependent oxidoreductase [Clostridia bacterium]